MAHFRRPLFLALNEAGCRSVAVGPTEDWCEGPWTAFHPVVIDRAGTNPLRDAATIWSYVRAFRQLRPAAVLGFTPKANIYAGIAARVCRIPFLPTVSGLGTGYLKSGLVRHLSMMLYRWSFATAAGVFFQNPDDRDEFVGRGLVAPERAFLVAGSGIDLAHFPFSPAPKNHLVNLLFVGRFLADKGLRELIEAVRILKAEGLSIGLTMVGATDPGNPSSIGGEEIGRWVDQGLATVVGHQDDVRPFIAEADAVVLPSYREGLPRVLLEGGAMGRPLIATDVPGCREVVVDGDTGLLCQARDAPSLATAIRSFLSLTRAQREEMGKEARRRVETRFDEALVVEQYRIMLSRLGVNGLQTS